MVGVTCGLVVMIFSWSHYADRYVLGHALGEPEALAVFSQYHVMVTGTAVAAVQAALDRTTLQDLVAARRAPGPGSPRRGRGDPA